MAGTARRRWWILAVIVALAVLGWALLGGPSGGEASPAEPRPGAAGGDSAKSPAQAVSNVEDRADPVAHEVVEREVAPAVGGLDASESDVRITVVVEDGGGNGMPGVAVQLRQAWGDSLGRGVTDDSGRWSCEARGVVTMPAYCTAETLIGYAGTEFDEPGDHEIRIVAREIRRLTGRVEDVEGQPVPGALVMGGDDSGVHLQQVAIADASGAFEVLVGRHSYALLARVPGRRDGMVQDARGETVVLRIGAEESRCVVHVHDVRGNAVPASIYVGRPAVLRVFNAERKGHDRWPAGREFATNDRGIADVGGLDAWTTDLLVIPHDEAFGRWQGQWRGEAEQRVQVDRSATLNVTVYDAGGQLVQGARVGVGDRRAWRQPRATTGVDGRCTIAGLAAGAAHVRATGPRRTAADAVVSTASGRATNVTLILGSKKRVRITRGASPVPGCLVEVSWQNEQFLAVTDENGGLGVPTAWFGELEVRCQRAGEWVTGEVAAAGADVLVVRLPQ